MFTLADAGLRPLARRMSIILFCQGKRRHASEGASRAAMRPQGSYTASLLDRGVNATGRKVTEEATEVLLAAKDDEVAEASGEDRSATRDALAGEVADLLYHALVLLAGRDVAPSAVMDVLHTRHAG